MYKGLSNFNYMLPLNGQSRAHKHFRQFLQFQPKVLLTMFLFRLFGVFLL